MVSCRWWENYVSIQSPIGIIKRLGRVKRAMIQTRYFTYVFISTWKIVAFFVSVMVILRMQGQTVGHLFSMFGDAFGEHKIVIQAIRATGNAVPDLFEILPNGETEIVNADFNTPIHVTLMAILGGYFMYIFGECIIRKVSILCTYIFVYSGGLIFLLLLSYHRKVRL